MIKDLSDDSIATATQIEPITDIAEKLHLRPQDLIFFGDHKAKLKPETIQKIMKNHDEDGHLILISAISPTPNGEGKTTTAIGLAQAIQQLGKSVSVTLREPSLGPTLGLKGGATGGGLSQVLPMDDINLHFTGDMHAVTTAHNLISAIIDNHLHYGNELNLDPDQIKWGRVMDLNDRALREIIIGLGGKKNGKTRETGFESTASSEIMAILCLALDYEDLKQRLDRILIGFSKTNEPIFLRSFQITGAVAALLRDAWLPNLVQTLEYVPAFIHGGPFANIAQGTNSVISTKIALRLSDFVVTEAGFGFDLGGEKYLNIVSRLAHFKPRTVVLVATVRSLKMHGGVLLSELTIPNPEAVYKGEGNLNHHVESVRSFGLEPIVAINKFITDTPEELKAIMDICEELEVDFSIVDYRNEGSLGGLELAAKIIELCRIQHMNYLPTYSLSDPLEDKIEKIAKLVYGATHVSFTPQATSALKKIHQMELHRLPVCISKTQFSLTDNPKILGKPTHFGITIRDLVIANGAGFIIALSGEMVRMPGLPKKPNATHIHLNNSGYISGIK